MELTPKENYMLAMQHKPTQWVPIRKIDCKTSGNEQWIEKGDASHERDIFGVKWVRPEAGGGQPVTDPHEHLLNSETIVDFEHILKKPDLDRYDFKSNAEQVLSRIDRDQFAYEFQSGDGPYERMSALMGFEEALVAMALEPEACAALCQWIVDYKIQVIERVAEYYHPDYWTNFDDVATQLNPFMSVESYREIILPATKRYYDAVIDAGMVPITHCCGHAEPILESMIESGAQAWSSVQPCNDIVSLLKEYGNRFTFIGGFDSTGPAGMPDASDEQIAAEVKRCIDTYGPYTGYIFMGFRTANTSNPQDILNEMMRVRRPAKAYAMEVAQRRKVLSS